MLAVWLLAIFPHPSPAATPRSEDMLNLSLIDGVRSPASLGLDYLRREPAELMANTDLISNIRRAAQQVSAMPEDLSLGIPLGTNRPVSVGEIPDDTGSPSIVERNPSEAIGFIGADGQTRPLTTTNLATMFDTEANNSGNLTMTPAAQEILVADASGTLAQTRRIPTFDLIVRNVRTNERFLLPRVNANAFCRDALNAVFNRNFRRTQ